MSKNGWFLKEGRWKDTDIVIYHDSKIHKETPLPVHEMLKWTRLMVPSAELELSRMNGNMNRTVTLRDSFEEWQAFGLLDEMPLGVLCPVSRYLDSVTGFGS